MNDDQQPQRPSKTLSPGSWTEAEVDAMQGRRVRFKDGNGEGNVRDAIGHVGKDGTIYQYAVHLTPDGGVTILLNKGGSERGDWAFDVLPGRLCPRKNATPCQNGEHATPQPPP